MTMLRASCALPFFAELPSLCLIDTPGLGAGTLESERALRESLPDPCACLLVFAADDPVVRESETAFLRELSLRGAPFHPVLTKCDKLLPAEREQAAAYLRESLADLTGTVPETVACVSARGDVEPVRELLRGLQSRAARLAENRLRQALLLAANQLREYLRMRRDAAGLTVPESARQIELLEERSRLLAGPLEEQARKLEQQAGDWERSLAARLAGTVERAAPSMEAMLLCEQNPASYVDDTLRAAALDSLRRELEPALRGYQKSVNALLRLQGVASGPDAAARCAVSPSWGVLAGFPGSDGLFAEILALLRGVPPGAAAGVTAGDAAGAGAAEALRTGAGVYRAGGRDGARSGAAGRRKGRPRAVAPAARRAGGARAPGRAERGGADPAAAGDPRAGAGGGRRPVRLLPEG